MSRVHIRFHKEQEIDKLITYRVESSDFNKAQNWEPIARITIDANRNSYTYDSIGIFLTLKVVPPFLYEMTTSDREKVLREDYQGFSCGGWTSRMSKMLHQMIASDNFP